MSFGKRGAGNDGAGRPPVPVADDLPPSEPVAGAPRLTVANPGSIDTRFIALTVGVVAISAALALFAPAMLAGLKPVRTIEQIVAADPDRDHIKLALATEAFPDTQGTAFLVSLHHEFPMEHDRLLGHLADTAKAGGDRDALAMEVNKWLVEFAPKNIGALGRTGSAGFNLALDVASDGLRYVKQTAGGCTLPALEGMMADPQKLLASVGYGSKGYEYNMKTMRQLVDLAAVGRDAQDFDTTLTPQDQSALQATMLSLMMDRDVMNLVQSGMMTASGQQPSAAMARDLATNLDVCGLGQRIVDKLRNLPDGTKGRLWATGAQELSKVIATGQLPTSLPDAMMGPGQLSMR